MREIPLLGEMSRSIYADVTKGSRFGRKRWMTEGQTDEVLSQTMAISAELKYVTFNQMLNSFIALPLRWECSFLPCHGPQREQPPLIIRGGGATK